MDTQDHVVWCTLDTIADFNYHGVAGVKEVVKVKDGRSICIIESQGAGGIRQAINGKGA